MDVDKIGLLIKKIRQDNNLTQLDLANKLGVTYQAVSKWENGRNIPDIAILKQICDMYQMDINEFLNGNSKSTKKTKKDSIIFLGIIIIIVILLILLLIPKNKFEFKTISSNCANFKITGSIAYNETKSSIYISNIDYCGGPNNEKYQEISCKLYEQSDASSTVIKECNKATNQTLEQFLQGLTFNVDDYNKTCKKYTENSLFLEIEAQKANEEKETFKIPLKLQENCDNDPLI